MLLKNRISVLIICALCLSCSQERDRHEDSYSAVLKGNRVEVTMAEYEPAFRNTMKGWREYFDPTKDVKREEYPFPFGSMTKEYMQWNMMENTASDGVDKVIEYSDHRWKGVEDINMKVIPRAYIVWVEPWHGGVAKNPDAPDNMDGWHWASDMPGETAPYKNRDGGWACYIDPADSLTPIVGGYFDPAFPERVEAFVAKLGEAWDNDPRVAYVEMGIIGEWGEHHDPDISTFWPPHDEPKHVAGRTWVPGIEKTLGDAFTKAFKNKKVMVRYAYEFQDYEFGTYWDSWSIDQEIDRGYNAMLARGDLWKTQVIGGEITWNWGSLALKGFRSLADCLADADTRQLVIEQVRNLHCNHLGGVTWSDFKDEEFYRNASEVQKAMGYRFVLDRAEYPAKLDNGRNWKMSFSLTNTGSSPFYYDWPVEVSLLEKDSHRKVWSDTFSNADITKWYPGDKWSVEQQKYLVEPETISVRGKFSFDNVPDGEYILALAILDPAGNRPSVRFANTNYMNGGYTALGYVGVGKKTAEPQIDTAVFDDIQSDKSLRYYIKKDGEVPVCIFDTDLGNDIDDVLALQMMLNYDKAGLVDLRAVTISKFNPHSIEFIDGFCRYNGYSDMPLGYAYNGVCPEDHMYLLPTLDAEYNGNKILSPERNIDSGIPEGYVEIRKQLAAAPDSSVLLIAVGPLTNIRRLIESGADEFSPLNGVELMKTKVKCLAIMCGEMTGAFAEWNLACDPDAARVVYEKCPVRMVASGWEVGNKVCYPHQSILNDFGNPLSSPLAVAYMHYMDMPYDRQCWDLTTVFDAIDADRSIYRHSPRGTITIDENNITRFAASPDGLHEYLIVDDEDVDRAVDALVQRVTWK